MQYNVNYTTAGRFIRNWFLIVRDQRYESIVEVHEILIVTFFHFFISLFVL